MDPSEENYLEINRQSWNERTRINLNSTFYDQPGFLAGKSSLNDIELALLGDIAGRSILHLQCHFGQDSISLSRLGANVTGVDLSDSAIEAARELAARTQSDTQFICCDIYDLPSQLEGQFDLIFTSYGVIGWLPDLDKWAGLIDHYLKPGGQLVLVEFHPVVWMFDDQFSRIKYDYFNTGAIIESFTGTYAANDSSCELTDVNWNHPLRDVIGSLLTIGLTLSSFEEYDYSPYDCFNSMTFISPGKYQIIGLEGRLPLVYSLVARKRKVFFNHD